MNGGPPSADAATSPAARLRQLRTSLGLSQEQLARQLGVSFATVNRWESGRSQLPARASRAISELEAQLAARSQVSGQLPFARSSFVGRAREIAELSLLLGQSRLITLTGPGGAGKTRLAIEVAGRQVPAGEVVFVPLEQVRPPRSAAAAVASCLRVHDQPAEPLHASLAAALAGAPRMLVLDGAEHLRDEVAGLAGALLAAVAKLRIVVTSRVVLGVPGEVCWAVPPLGCPSAAAGASDIASSDAVRLFMARAAERLPGFGAADVAPHAVAELCRRLDGVPLAIELIAGWVGTLSIQEILQQRAALLDQGDGGQGGRRLVDVLSASHGLLKPDQQRMLRTLSVFAGPFGVPDAQAASGLDGPAAASTVRALVDASWLVVTRGAEQNQFSMLEVIRTFAAARLDASGEGPQVRRWHAVHFGELARASEAGLAGPGAARLAEVLWASVADINAAMQWAEDNADVDLGLDVSASLWRWWLTSGRLAVGRAWLGKFLALAGPRRDEQAGRALCAAAVLAAENGDYAEAVRQARLALAVFEPLGLQERMAFAATVLGSAHRYLGDRDAARRSFQAAMDLRASIGDRRGVSVAMNNMALLALDDGDLAAARELFEKTLVIKRQLGEQRSVAIGLANLADAAIRMGQLPAAGRALAEAAELAAGIGDPQLVYTIRCNQGNLAASQRHWTEAAAHYQAAVTASREPGQPHGAVEAMIGLGRACHGLGRRADAVRHLRAAEAAAGVTANPLRMAEVRAALAEIGESATSPLPDGLTRRQAEVLRLLASGLSNRQIAAELCLSPATVERHLATIYRRLGLGGRVEATRYAVSRGLADAVSAPAGPAR